MRVALRFSTVYLVAGNSDAKLPLTDHGATAVAIEAGLLSKAQVQTALHKMRANIDAVAALPDSHGQRLTLGLTMWPAYPVGAFGPAGCNRSKMQLNGGCKMPPFNYQNAGDWSWFGGRMVQQLVQFGLLKDASSELQPMVDRVCSSGDFREWYGLKLDDIVEVKDIAEERSPPLPEVMTAQQLFCQVARIDRAGPDSGPTSGLE